MTHFKVDLVSMLTIYITSFFMIDIENNLHKAYLLLLDQQ